MMCNETCGSTPFRNRLARKTYSSIRCSRQTQRTQLESIENRNLNEQQQHLHQGCYTINEKCTLIDQSFGTQNGEQFDVSGTGSCIFTRGPTQLRDSRRKTAEQWRSRKHLLVNDENCLEEIRPGQKVKFSPVINNPSFLRNLKNIMENKEIVHISTIKNPQDVQIHLLPSLFSPSTIGLKFKSCNFESNFGFIHHSDSSYRIKSSTQSTELLLRPAGLDEIEVNASGLNTNPLNEMHNYIGTLRGMNCYRSSSRKKQIIGKNIASNDETNIQQRTISFFNSRVCELLYVKFKKKKKKKK
ncbi:unnamed protein product, partial [Onchocerca flexuosa]|uniref:Uncharacterized protein n=1 Tax=Onchocerca flexuosa TaxID=387005 RepID=A0A183HLE1_9BILA